MMRLAFQTPEHDLLPHPRGSLHNAGCSATRTRSCRHGFRPRRRPTAAGPPPLHGTVERIVVAVQAQAIQLHNPRQRFRRGDAQAAAAAVDERQRRRDRADPGQLARLHAPFAIDEIQPGTRRQGAKIPGGTVVEIGGLRRLRLAGGASGATATGARAAVCSGRACARSSRAARRPSHAAAAASRTRRAAAAASRLPARRRRPAPGGIAPAPRRLAPAPRSPPRHGRGRAAPIAAGTGTRADAGRPRPDPAACCGRRRAAGARPRPARPGHAPCRGAHRRAAARSRGVRRSPPCAGTGLRQMAAEARGDRLALLPQQLDRLEIIVLRRPGALGQAKQRIGEHVPCLAERLCKRHRHHVPDLVEQVRVAAGQQLLGIFGDWHGGVIRKRKRK